MFSLAFEIKERRNCSPLRVGQFRELFGHIFAFWSIQRWHGSQPFSIPKHALSLLVIGSLALSCQDHSIGTDDPAGVKVFGLTEQIDGKGYKELNEIAVKWFFPASLDDSPLNDSTGSRSAANLQPLANVMILATNLGGVSTRSLTIPSGRNVFFTIAGSINFYYDNNLCDPT